MKLLICCCLAVASFGFASAVEVPETTTTSTKDMAWMTTCWGEDTMTKFMTTLTTAMDKCFQTPTVIKPEDVYDTTTEPFPTNSTTTMTGDKIDATMFKDGLARSRWEKIWKMSNLTCVMRTMGKWNADNTVNMDFYTKTIWETATSVDETFKTEMTTMFTRCWKMATSIPTELATDKFTALFLTRMKFHKCESQWEDMICAKKLMTKWMEAALGPYTDDMATSWGFPANDTKNFTKYDAAAIYHGVKLEETPVEKRFVKDFFVTRMFGKSTTILPFQTTTTNAWV